jgi:hypothetical protein
MCSVETPCSGKPYARDPIYTEDHNNLTGVVRFVCTTRTCTRDYWLRPEPVKKVAAPSLTQSERVRIALNETQRHCQECGEPMVMNSNSHKRCEECAADALARSRKVSQETR